jgi:hypothetical protein
MKTTQTGISIEAAEKHYGAKFVGDFCLPDKNGDWFNEPLAVFYQPNPPAHIKGCTNYFGLIVRNEGVYIMDALPCFKDGIDCILDTDGQLLYSAYRHDYVVASDGFRFIDGGRDYLRTNASKVIKCKVVEDKLVPDE